MEWETIDSARAERTTQHTPGPWTDCKIDGMHAYRVTAKIQVAGFAVPQSIAIVSGSSARTSKSIDAEEMANAHLIAAAPDLLAALQLIYANAAESPEWIRERIGPVIAQATGQS